MTVSSATLTWVVGAGGLVGRHTVAALAARGHEVLTSTIPWSDPSASVEALTAGVDILLQRAGDRPWALVWCAGAGVVATPAEALATEQETFAATLTHLADRLEGAGLDAHSAEGRTATADWRRGQGGAVPGRLVLASSAGGVYAGCSGAPFDETTPARPLVAYGHTKLAMERQARLLTERTGIRTLLARIANVYGPGQELTKPQGLISQICLSHATGTPLPVFVSLDVIRDYVYAPDVGALLAAGLDRLSGHPPGEVVTKVVASGRPVTVGHLIGEARRVLHRPLRTSVIGGRSAGQVLDLRLRSRVWSDLDAVLATTLPAGLAATAADVLARTVVSPTR